MEDPQQQPKRKYNRVSKLSEEEKSKLEAERKEQRKLYQRQKYIEGANTWKLNDLSNRTLQKLITENPDDKETFIQEKQRLGPHFNTIYRTKKFLDRLPKEVVIREFTDYLTSLQS